MAESQLARFLPMLAGGEPEPAYDIMDYRSTIDLAATRLAAREPSPLFQRLQRTAFDAAPARRMPRRSAAPTRRSIWPSPMQRRTAT
jgi:hypothetical protein